MSILVLITCGFRVHDSDNSFGFNFVTPLYASIVLWLVSVTSFNAILSFWGETLVYNLSDAFHFSQDTILFQGLFIGKGNNLGKCYPIRTLSLWDERVRYTLILMRTSLSLFKVETWFFSLPTFN